MAHLTTGRNGAGDGHRERVGRIRGLGETHRLSQTGTRAVLSVVTVVVFVLVADPLTAYFCT